MRKPAVPKKPRKCSACGGTGTKVKWTKDRNGKWISYNVTCDNCGGTGTTTAT